MKTVDDMRRVLKKLFHNYSLVVIVALIFATIIVVLLGSRYFALASIRDLSQINPLITSTENRLVTTDATGKIVKAPVDSLDADGEGSGQSSATSKKSSSGSSGSSSGSSGGTATGGGTTQGANNTANTNTGTTNQGNTTTSGGSSTSTPAFSFSIGSVTYSPGLILGGNSNACKREYNFVFNITAQNASGNTISYEFKEVDGIKVTSIPGEPITFNSGETSKSIPHKWTIESPSSRGYALTLSISSPESTSKTYTFNTSCRP